MPDEAKPDRRPHPGTAPSPSDADRLAGIDGLRYLLCLAVALLHSLPNVAGRTTTAWAAVAACLCRGAVPFFFIASGSFARVPATWSWSVIERPLRRLFPVYLAWFLAYAAVDRVQAGRWTDLSVKGLVTGGTAFHLWFIPVLGLTLAAVPSALAWAGSRLTAAAALAIAILGLAFGAYHAVFHLPELGGVRLTEAPALVLLGYATARTRPTFGPCLAGSLVAACMLLLVVEEALIAGWSHAPIVSHDVTLMTYALGFLLYLLGLSLNDARRLGPLAGLGRISLGVYATHLFFVRLCGPWLGNGSLPRACMLAVAAFSAATLVSLLLARWRPTRWLVR